ncbi:uncharacterized protein LOC124637162 [Helicoverpa zea]|uniref:uncharacterized protein LOC124637162 n=1 Tax=Helicoverpa zea TaxID=7113 RepID=UPI001F5AEA18|nr:uncharacterized protein LOC124637162 [Helicoverpa zea]
MAITSLDVSCDKIPTKSSCSAHSSKGGNSCRLVKINFASADGRLSSAASKLNKAKKNNPRSPYLTGDRVQLLSRVTEKRLVHKKTTDIVSSFPLAVNIYKANSDEFKSSKKANKKVKKSVLTLPNDPAPAPQCTVSDMNDSEYCEKNIRVRKQKVKKRSPMQNSRKARVREKDFEFYDRDDINLDCSSTDMIKNFNGDGKRISNKKKNLPPPNKTQTASNDLSDVWTVLRNINKFQFRPSPPMSEASIIPVKKRVQKRQRRSNRKDTRVIETCRTQEFAYISSYEVDDKTNNSFSQSSSIDRITVIDKKNEFSKICEEFEKRLLKTHEFLKDSNNNKTRTQKHKNQRKLSKGNLKAIGSGGSKENKQLIPLKKKKKSNFKSSFDQQYKCEPTNNSVNKDSLIDGENTQVTDDSDILSHKTDVDSMLPTNGSCISSEYSGSSRCELSDKNNDKVIRTDNAVEDPHSQLKDSIRTVQNKDQESASPPKRLDPQKRKPRLVTTMPSSCMMPKPTQTEIKRRLANIKFPIVILGKDQVSSGIKVMDEDPPQFSGLDEHIWPFMAEWSPQATKDTKPNNFLDKKCNSFLSDTNSSKSRKSDKGTRKRSPLKENKPASGDPTIYKKKFEVRRPMEITDITEKLLQCTRKQKSIVQLKDKMLNFLYKKSSCRNINSLNEESNAKSSAIIENKKADAIEPAKPENILALTELPKRRTFASPFPTVGKNKRIQNYAYPWAKAKWASDFIENVIKKIRSGVYYTQEHRDTFHRYQIGVKEVSVQAGSVCDSSDSTQTYDSDTETEHAPNTRNPIPGFEKTLPMLEIKTLNMNQIAVKHCVTNVIVQFDVILPAKSEQTSTNTSTYKSSPLIPVEITDSHTKVFKCKTTIFNAVLPAEICSILPQMMSAIIDTNSNTTTAMCPTKTDSCLSTITEQTRCEAGESLSGIASSHRSTEIKPAIQGSFTNKAYKKPIPTKIYFRFDYDNLLAEELLPKVSLDGLVKYEINPRLVEIDNTKCILSLVMLRRSIRQKSSVTDMVQTNTSTSMEVYTGSKRSVCPAYKPLDIVGVIKSILRTHHLQINMNLTSYFDMLKMKYDGKNIKINMSLTNCNGEQKNVVVTVNNLKVDSLFEALPKMNIKKKNSVNKNNPIKVMDYANTSLAGKSENMEINRTNCTKVKRKGFYKLYRKCKSTTNIPSAEKCTSTPLSKITTLEDFFQILGSKRMLCSVFDGYSAKKILSSISEMKNWITEINAKQAMLILLLTNKKDTQNLVRFRPIILQGIAVNRITRASELDMEIEVIERENLNKFPQQFEGISYLPESVTNYDNLMEELYWIAKTTASDYQKPFDETSERLLRSLLEKRKKLNPSYLRVMARYVGLGLLKSPAKC